MSLSKKQRINLYAILFRGQSEAILKAKENKSYLAFFNKDEQKRIFRNLDEISKYAAEYYWNKYGSSGADGNISRAHIEESLKAAILAVI
ncbi:MAG: hypothetical protein DAHOPDDO_00801 [Ignavibacteriaceae bacterium]|nr:hypothetical protein [Ignavibacteriaceae bacterium]